MTMYMMRSKLFALIKRASEVGFLVSLVLYALATLDRLLPTIQFCDVRTHFIVGFLIVGALINIVSLVVLHRQHWIHIDFQAALAKQSIGMRYLLLALGANSALTIGMEINTTNGAAVSIIEGVKVLHYKGSVIKELTDQAFTDYQCLEVAVFTSLLVLTFALLVALLPPNQELE